MGMNIFLRLYDMILMTRWERAGPAPEKEVMELGWIGSECFLSIFDLRSRSVLAWCMSLLGSW